MRPDGSGCLADRTRATSSPIGRSAVPIKGSVCVAHNLKGYDSYFILKYLYDNRVLPKLIMNGAKVMELKVTECDIRMIDSLNFLPMPLAQFPNTFGLTELAKGYFPHFFNTTNNQTYVVPLPNVEYYDPDGMKPKARTAFLAWHAKQRSKKVVFDFSPRTDQILPLRCGHIKKMLSEVFGHRERIVRFESFRTLHHHCVVVQLDLSQHVVAGGYHRHHTAVGISENGSTVGGGVSLVGVRGVTAGRVHSTRAEPGGEAVGTLLVGRVVRGDGGDLRI